MSSESDVMVTLRGPVLMTRTVKVTGPPGSWTTVGLAVFSRAMEGMRGLTVTCSSGSAQGEVLGR